MLQVTWSRLQACGLRAALAQIVLGLNSDCRDVVLLGCRTSSTTTRCPQCMPGRCIVMRPFLNSAEPCNPVWLRHALYPRSAGIWGFRRLQPSAATRLFPHLLQLLLDKGPISAADHPDLHNLESKFRC